MLVVLSHFNIADADLERRVAAGRAELFIQAATSAKQQPLPTEIRRRADAVVQYDPNTTIDGTPLDYPRCRIVVRCGVGFDSLDIAGWGAEGVSVSNVPDYGTSEVADHAMALMLALTRGTATYHDILRADPVANWSHAKAPVVRRLRGATFGIVGLGRIGLATAMRARGFDLNIAFYDPHLPSGMEIAVGARRCSTLNDLMALSDIVSIHAPSSPETRGLVGSEALSHAKPGQVIVNTARGNIIDLDALNDALSSGRIAAAGLDVLPAEPADRNHPLIAAWLKREPWLDGRLTLSPHAAFYSPDGMVDLRTKTIETALAPLETGRAINCVNAHLINEVKHKARQSKT